MNFYKLPGRPKKQNKTKTKTLYLRTGYSPSGGQFVTLTSKLNCTAVILEFCDQRTFVQIF